MKALPWRRTAIAGIAVLAVSSLAQVTTSTTEPPDTGATGIGPSSDSPWSVVERGAHHRVLQRVTWQTNAQGHVQGKVGSYTELATGMARLLNGRYVDASDQIQVTATGAQATNAVHSLSFLGNLNLPGAIDLTLSDGRHLTSSILGLSYREATTGNAVWLGEIQDSYGELLPSGNRALYRNAFSGCTASVLYVNSISGIDQMVVLEEQLPDPSEWGLNPSEVVLEVITAFYGDVEPTATQAVVGDQLDEELDFGPMKMVRGKAFALGAETNAVPVTKRWLVLDGQRCLVEQVPFERIQPYLRDLPPSSQHARITPPGSSLFQLAGTLRLPGRKASLSENRPLRLASAKAEPKGFAMDYTLVTSQADMTFDSDKTYYIAGQVNLTGNTVIMGGSVLKFTNHPSARISLFGPLTCKTGPFRMAVLTSKDDRSCGQDINGSTGNPTNYNGGTYLQSNISGSPTYTNIYRYLRISYAGTGLQMVDASRNDIWDCQFVRCGTALDWCDDCLGSLAGVHNALFAQCGCALTSLIHGEHLTIDGGGLYLPGVGGPASFLTNCLLTAVTNLGDVSHFGYCRTNATSNGYYQTVGAGNYYLAPFSPARGVGTAAIPADILTEIRAKTTQPPGVYAATNITENLILSPQVQRDTASSPDCGWHYDCVDWAFGGAYINTPLNLTVTPGTVIAAFGTNSHNWGLGMGFGASLVCAGAPTNLIRIVAHNTVMEGPTNSGWMEPGWGLVTDGWAQPDVASSLSFRFVDFSSLAQDVYAVYSGATNSSLQDCQVHGGMLVGYPTSMNLTNNLLERVFTDIESYDGKTPVVRNNTFYCGIFGLLPNVTNAIVKDNLFDRTSFYYSLVTTGYNGGHNAFVTNTTPQSPASYTLLYPTQTGDLISGTSPAYQQSWLGPWYLPSGSSYVNAGAATADAVGLYHYTTQTNQSKEGTSTIDLGFHVVATDNSGSPLDYDSGGAPDWLENTAGDGHTNNVNETNWKNNVDDFNYLLVPQYLRCEYLQNPLGVETRYGPPRLYWIVTSPRRAEKQVSYRVLVSTDTNNLALNVGDMWDSHEIYSDQTTHVEYKGSTLQSGQRLYWKVGARDRYTGITTWSTNASFQMGLLNASDWQAQWLTTATDPGGNVSPMYRHAFVQRTNDIKRATAYVSAKGVYELWIDGQRIGQNVLAPEWTDYNQRFQYQTYDVTTNLVSTNAITDGTNHVIGAIVGEGWFHGSVSHDAAGYYYYTNYNTAHGPKQILVQLQIERTDYSSNVITSSSAWKCSINGPIQSASMEHGETNDATKLAAISNWSTFQYTGEGALFNTTVATESLIATQMVTQPTDPIKVVDYVHPIDMWTNRDGGEFGARFVRVFDMGRIIEGWCTLSLTNTNEPTGTNIYLRHAESLQLDSNYRQVRGTNINDLSLRGSWGSPPKALQKETYVILQTNIVQQFQPHFTYHSFRFIEVDAPEDIALNTNSILGCVIRTSMPTTGVFGCSHRDVNQLMTNTLRTLEANVFGLPTACADRNERYGWFCDTDVAAQTSAFLLDMGALWTKSIRDIRDDQYGGRTNGNYYYHGSYSIINPTVGGGGVGDVGISSGGVVRPWRLYQNYADSRMLREDYLSVSNWMGFLSENFTNLNQWQPDADILNMDSFNQFHPLPHDPTWPTTYAQMSAVIHGLWAYIYSADLVANMSKTLQAAALASGDGTSANVYGNNYTTYSSMAAAARTYFTNATNGLVTYDSQTGTQITKVGAGTQADYAMALQYNLVPDNQRANCAALMLNDPNKGILYYNHNWLSDCTNHLSTGSFATQPAMSELTRNGYNSKAYEILTGPQFPSWLYQITNGGPAYSGVIGTNYGATTCWEHWNGWLSGSRGGYFNTSLNGYNSFNELWNASVGEWVWRNVAGFNLDETNPGFQNVVIYPRPGGGITNCSASFNSIHGTIRSSWTNGTSTYALSVTVPANTTASVFLSGATNLASITENGLPATNAAGLIITPVVTNGAALFQIGSGSYNFYVTF